MRNHSFVIVIDLVFFLFSSLSVALMLLYGDKVGPGSPSSIIFLCWFAFTLIFLLQRVQYVAQLFSPSFLAFLYIGLSYAGGSSIPRDLYVWVYHDAITRIDNFSMINGYLLACLSIFALIAAQAFKRSEHVLKKVGQSTSLPNKAQILLSFVLLIVLSFIDFYLMFGFRFGLAVIIAVNLTKIRRRSWAILGFIILVLVILLTSFQNKREILLVIFLIVFSLSAARQSPFNYSPKNLLLGFCILSTILMAILAASISRGYGGFETRNPIESLLFIGRYISSPMFFGYFLENIEIVHTYASTIAAIDYTARGEIQLQAGATLIKPLFLPIPREIAFFKPESAISIFTTTLNPSFAATGNSLPVTIPAEVFMNFHFMGPIFLIFAFLVLERVFRAALRAQAYQMKFKGYLAIVLAMLPLIMVRGGGFDLYVLTAILSIPAYLTVALSSR